LARLDGAPAGFMSQECTGPNLFTSTLDCTGAFQLKDGDVTVQGLFVPAVAEQSAAVTGGTGEFANARGEAIIRAEDDQITLRLFL
jgi:hypothetical protein